MPAPWSAARAVVPIGVSVSFWPLMTTFTLPDGINFAFANNSKPTKISVTTKKMTTAAAIVVVDITNRVITKSLLNDCWN
jgi:hypothetical protein